MMREIIRTRGNKHFVVTLLLFLSGALLMPFIGLPSEGYHWQVYANVYSPTAMDVNYRDGAPGSFFTVTGYNFAPDDWLGITANGVLLGDVRTDESGAFTVLLDSAQASEGSYYIATDAANSPRAAFRVTAAAPVRAPEGSGDIFLLPSGIAWQIIHLPFIQR